MKINRDQVLRYLGFQKNKALPNQAMMQKIDDTILQGLSLIEGNYTYRLFHQVKRNEFGIYLPEANLTLPGNDILNHLSDCSKVYLVAITIGEKLETKVSQLFQVGEYANATILDAVGSDAVEQLADQMQEFLQLSARKQGYYLTWRFCSGYGDLPLTINRQIANLLKTDAISIKVNESSMLQPQKSILGVVGLKTDTLDAPLISKCSYCKDKNCPYRNRSDQCAKSAKKKA